MLHECEVDGYFIRSMNSLYKGGRSCVKLCSRVGEHFEVRWGMRKGCVMFPWLFNIFFYRVVRQVNERAAGREVVLEKRKF